jgi:histidyl-tRNA synthetase
VLDCKVEKCQKIIEKAPQTLDYLCQECRSHFKEVLEFLDTIELPYFLNTHLVRGLDYYTKTVFEISNKDEVGQKIGALVGGGRYDDLVKLLGGKNTPACGASGGVERIVALMKAQNIELKEEEEEESIFFAQLGDLARKKGLKILEELKKAKIKVKSDFTKDSLKSQLKLADKFKTRYVLIFGQKEAMENTIIIKDMKKGQQESVKLESLIKRLKKKI